MGVGGRIGVTLAAAVGLALSAPLFLIGYTALRTHCNFTARGEDLLIVAPHPDDCVIMAGGYAMQTLQRGGRVRVAWLTGTPDRFREGRNAWGLIGLGPESLIEVRLAPVNLDLDHLEEWTRVLRELVAEAQPDVVVVPLYEGGHRDHDLANYLTARAVASLPEPVELLEAPLYNYYFSLRHTPEKLLDALSKRIPFYDYNAPPTFVASGPRRVLCMSEPELALKRRMLEQFVSQHPEDLVLHFAFNDRFQRYREHDYTSPPHDYGIGWIRSVREEGPPWLARYFDKPYWKRKTIFAEKDRRPLGPLLPPRD
jgi:LmbE family N-acetylglucosaminyl deacetylase